MHLTRTGEERVLRVHVDTETPCFDAFLVQRDEGSWSVQREAAWDWRLHCGRNRLAVRTRNSAGVCGPESRVEAVWPG